METGTGESSASERSGRREFLRRISYGGFGGALAGSLTPLASVGSDKSQPLPRRLKPFLRDTFDTFDTQRWQIWKDYNPRGASVEARAGRARVSASKPAKQPGPGAMA